MNLATSTLLAPPAKAPDDRGDAPCAKIYRSSTRDPRTARRAHRGLRWLRIVLSGPLYIAAVLTVALAWIFERLSIPGWTIDSDEPS